jgi:hypothetical protein
MEFCPGTPAACRPTSGGAPGIKSCHRAARVSFRFGALMRLGDRRSYVFCYLETLHRSRNHSADILYSTNVPGFRSRLVCSHRFPLAGRRIFQFLAHQIHLAADKAQIGQPAYTRAARGSIGQSLPGVDSVPGITRAPTSSWHRDGTHGLKLYKTAQRQDPQYVLFHRALSPMQLPIPNAGQLQNNRYIANRDISQAKTVFKGAWGRN